MPELVSEWTTTGGIEAPSRNTFVNVLTGRSAVLQATQATGGVVTVDADFIPRNIPIVTGNALPTKVTENTNKPVVEVTPGTATLTVEMWAKFHQASRQAWRSTPTRNVVNAVLQSSTGQFPIAYDIEVLTATQGANRNTDVEYDASAPVTSVSSLLAPYDEESFGPDQMAVVLTRAGARKLGYSVDTQGRLQGGPSAMFGDLPVFTTLATGTNVGTATAMAIVGPFGAGEWATAGGVMVDYLPQATVDGKGPEQNIENWRVEGAFGYANGVDYDGTGRGFTTLIDAA